jgi:uncharacterized membrane protein
VIVVSGTYLNWGVIQLSLTNFLIIVIMLVVFALAILVPFNSRHDRNRGDRS